MKPDKVQNMSYSEYERRHNNTVTDVYGTAPYVRTAAEVMDEHLLTNKKIDKKINTIMQGDTVNNSSDTARISDTELIKYMESTYPVMTSNFKDIQYGNYLLFLRKQYTYGPDNIALGKTLENETDRRISLTGLFFRLNDKISRLKQMLLIGNADQVGEGVEDTVQDIAIYGVISQLIKNGTWGK